MKFTHGVFTREISSRDETIPGIKSSLSMVKCLLLFTRFCRDEISSRDELVLVRVRLHVTETKFYPGIKKFLFTTEFHPGMKRVESHPGMKFNLNENLLLSTKTYRNLSF